MNRDSSNNCECRGDALHVVMDVTIGSIWATVAYQNGFESIAPRVQIHVSSVDKGRLSASLITTRIVRGLSFRILRIEIVPVDGMIHFNHHAVLSDSGFVLHTHIEGFSWCSPRHAVSQRKSSTPMTPIWQGLLSRVAMCTYPSLRGYFLRSIQRHQVSPVDIL